jgi:hypothetical protein
MYWLEGIATSPGPAREVTKDTQSGTFMNIRAIAAVAGLGLLAAACSQPAPPAPVEPTPVADQPATPAIPDAFAYAVNYECEGGGVVDVVYKRQW